MSADIPSSVRALVEAFPEGAAVPVPRAWLVHLLDRFTADPDSMPSPDLTVAQVASRYGRTPSTVRGWVQRGLFPGSYLLQGRDRRFPTAALLEFEKSQQSPKKTPPTDGHVTIDLGAWRSAS